MSEKPGLKNAAIVLKSLPKKQAARIVSTLEPHEIQSVLEAMEQVDQIAAGDIESTMEKLDQAAGLLDEDGDSPAGLPARFRSHPLPGCQGPPQNPDDGSQPFQFLQGIVPALCCQLLQDEHPQNIAIVLSWIDPGRASEILKNLEPANRVSVLRRLCEYNRTANSEVTELSYALKRRLKKLVSSENYCRRGVDTAANLLSCTDARTQADLLDYLNQSDPELAARLLNSVVHIADLQRMSDRDIKTLLQAVDTTCWAPALKPAALETRAKVLRNMAEAPAGLLSQEIANLGPVDELTSAQAQKAIINEALRLHRLGRIDLPIHRCH